MKQILKSLFVVVAVAGIAGAATWAQFSDAETSNNNTFSAGSLDLKLDNGDVNVVKFNVTNAHPGTQVIKTYKVKNAGTVNGWLDLKDITVTNAENSCLEPETEAGDTSCDPSDGNGELQNVSNFDIFVDNNCDGYFDAGDSKFFAGKAGTIAGSYNLNLSLTPDQEKCITNQYDWWSGTDDNKAQGDSMVLNMGFQLLDSM